jgi:hypothetical protein
MKLSSPARKALLTVHVGTAVAVIGADLSLFLLGLAALGGVPPLEIYPAALIIGERAIVPLALTAIATGLALALFGPYGLLRYWWVPLKLTITGALTAAVFTVLLPGLRAAAAAAGSGSPVSDAQRLPLAIAPLAAITLLGLAVALAVFKPAWRLRRA